VVGTPDPKARPWHADTPPIPPGLWSFRASFHFFWSCFGAALNFF
jgi:hypothetical protein